MLAQQYCLKWKYHDSNILSTFASLRDSVSYCDVTLWCAGVAMKAHRAVLASCSNLFNELLGGHDPSLGEPALVLTDSVHAHHLRHLLSFMYTGEVSVPHTELASLLKTAEELQIKGLAEVTWKETNDVPECSVGSSTEISLTSGGAKPITPKAHENILNVPKSKISVAPLKNIINGSVVSDPPKRKRGRPPLEPKSSIENELIHDAPKRPNILRKSKPVETKNDSVMEIATWGSGNQENEVEEILSEYSEASLDGRDISHFLDTTMEEPSEEVIKSFDSSKSASHSTHEFPVKENHNFPDVVKLSDYLMSGRRTQFWAEDYVKRVMEAVFCRELEMKQAAEILGVSYGTLYGRYRDTFGCINRPYRAREFWAENADILAKLQRKEISFIKAAELLHITPQLLFTYVNSINEPVIIQNDTSDAYPDTIARPIIRTENAKTSSENDSIKSGELDVKESYDRLSNIFRKHLEESTVEVTEHTTEKIESKVTTIDDSSNNASETEAIIDMIAEENTPEKNENATTLNPESISGNLAVTVTSPTNPKKLPMIRVANLKFLKGDSIGAANIADISASDKASPIVLKTLGTIIRPDIKMITSKRKVTMEEIEHSLKHSKTILPATPTTAVKPPTSIS